jgi:uncharacterized protein (TIGR03435 family)
VQPGGRLVVRNVALKDLIAAAYGMADIPPLVPDRILGGPDWIGSERYNIDAKASTEFHFAPGGPPKDMLLMLRSLLDDRFKLVAHRETRDMPIFELVVAREDGRLGPGLHKSSVDCNALTASSARRTGTPLAGRLIPAPIAGQSALRSTSSGVKPLRCSAAATERPAIPPPTTRIRPIPAMSSPPAPRGL